MSTLHKVKAYFGMAPMDDYDDEYYEDDDRDTGARPRIRPSRRAFRRRRLRRPAAPATTTRPFRRRPTPRVRRPRRAMSTPADRWFPAAMPRNRGSAHASSTATCRRRPGFGSLRGSTRGALAMDPRRMAELFEEGSPLSKITTLRPKDYSEARTIGERFRDGQPVIMDLVSMDNADAKRLVDFAAGLAFALRGSLRQGRHQGVPAGAGRCRRQRRGAPPDRRGGFLQLPVRRPAAGRPAIGRLADVALDLISAAASHSLLVRTGFSWRCSSRSWASRCSSSGCC